MNNKITPELQEQIARIVENAKLLYDQLIAKLTVFNPEDQEQRADITKLINEINSLFDQQAFSDLEHASSVVGLMLTCNAVVLNESEKSDG